MDYIINGQRMAHKRGSGMMCQALDANGKQCTESAGNLYNYFGDEVVEKKPTWVRVWLCLKCADGRISG